MAPDCFSVADKVVIVTGGLGQLGRQFSRALLDRGAKVAVFDVRAADLAAREAFGDHREHPSVSFHGVDITSRESIRCGLGEVTARWGTPEGLINNAALDVPPNAPSSENGPFETYPASSLDKILEVNVKGLFLCCQEVGGAMAQAGRGSIVNISSIYGLVSPDQRIYEYRRQRGEQFFKPAAYSVSKSAILNLSRYLATYWADRGVRVNTLSFAGVFNNQDQQFLNAYCKKVPLGRMAREDEYNGAIIFLMSSASSYMTGSNIVIDGGWTAW